MSDRLPVLDLGRRSASVPLGRWSALVIGVLTVIGAAAFSWPLWSGVGSDPALSTQLAPFLLSALLPILVVLALAQLTEGGLDSRSLAMLGVLSALNAAIRAALGAGTAGFESVFFLLILAGRVFGPGFGFLLGCTSLFASALLTGGVGPWLPFQMLCCAWIGLGAGLLPRSLRGRGELAMLVVYGIASAYLFGLLMNLWSWPFLTGTAGSVPGGAVGALAPLPGAALSENLQRFGWFTLLTSTGGWDTGRAVATTAAMLILGPALLPVFRRVDQQP